jgi:hypothetical protein
VRGEHRGEAVGETLFERVKVGERMIHGLIPFPD